MLRIFECKHLSLLSSRLTQNWTVQDFIFRNTPADLEVLENGIIKHTDRQRRGGEEDDVLTIPGVEHVGDEVVYEGDLRFGHAAGVPVKHRHHHGKPLSLLLVRLQVKHTHITIS